MSTPPNASNAACTTLSPDSKGIVLAIAIPPVAFISLATSSASDY